MNSLDTQAAQQALLAAVPRDLYIDGQWRPASSGKTFEVINPATEQVIAHVADASADDAVAAMDAACTAQEFWAATAPRIRAEILRRAWELVHERREELALLMTLEMGKPLAEARGEVTYGGEFLRWFSEEAVRIQGRFTPNPEGTGTIMVSHRPVGPAYFITPWNFPLAMATRKIAPALAAGCTVVIKPPQLTPLTTAYFVQILHDAGLPAGVVNMIPAASSRGVSAPIIADPRLRKLSFTGSTPVGQALIAQAADNVLKVSMELGGNAPFVVFDDADMDKAVGGAMDAKFRNIGQACTAANRFIVHESRVDEFARRVTERVAALKIGAGTDPGVEIGPLVEQSAVDKVASLVQDAVDRGAQVTTGGHQLDRPGYFYAPTVLVNVPSDADIVREEIFGPVLAITSFRDEDQAVAMANDTEYGLASYVFTESLARGHRMIDKIDAGMMGLNAGVMSNAAAPFGGLKQSGTGREGGVEGIHEFLEVKYTYLPAA